MNLNDFERCSVIRKEVTISVSGGTGTISLTNVRMRSNFIGVAGPNQTNETFYVTVRDTEADVIISDFQARSNNVGNARSKTIGLLLQNISITITSASVDGDYKVLIMG